MNRDRCQRRKSSDEGDAFIKLPEDLLIHILSFLSTKEAALTSALSKRWRDLFTLIPSLDFDDSFYMPCASPEACPRTSFIEFVNRVLALKSTSPITKFSLICYEAVDQDIFGDWILKALGRGATDLTIIVLFPIFSFTLLPDSIFLYARNLIKLKLGSGNIIGLCHLQKVIFTNLRTLHLDSITFGQQGGTLPWLLSKCPMLEELIVNCINWHNFYNPTSVCSPTLKRLTIDGEQYLHIILRSSRIQILRWEPDYKSIEPHAIPSHFGTENPHEISFNTPNLLYFNYSDFVARNYPLVKLDSLVEARLDVGLKIYQMRARDADKLEIRWDATNLIMGIQNVQTLHLTSDTFDVYFSSFFSSFSWLTVNNPFG